MNGLECFNSNRPDVEIRVQNVVNEGTKEDGNQEVGVITYSCLKSFFTNWHIVIIFGLIIFYVDVGFDSWLLWTYMNQKRYVYFGLTFVFVLLPALIINVLSMIWYSSDESVENNIILRFRRLFHILLLGPAWRHLECLHFTHKYGSESNKKTKFAHMIADLSLLKLLEAYLESAPQCILQLYILITEWHFSRNDIDSGFLFQRNPHTQLLSESSGFGLNPTDGDSIFENINARVAAMTVALASLSYAQTSYKRTNRIYQSDKANISFTGLFFLFFWHLFMVGSRILALTLFATIFISGFPLVYVGLPVVLIIRFVVMEVMLNIVQSIVKNMRNIYSQSYYQLIFGLVHLFTFVNLDEEPTLRRYLHYYTYDVIENLVLITLWANFVNHDDAYTGSNFYWIALIFYVVGSILGFACMLMYYIRFHPSRPRNDLVTVCRQVLSDL